MNNSIILVTGGAGFVGSNLIQVLLNNFDIKEILIVDNLLSSESSNVVSHKKVNFIYGSI